MNLMILRRLKEEAKIFKNINKNVFDYKFFSDTIRKLFKNILMLINEVKPVIIPKEF